MMHGLLGDARFYRALLEIDRREAQGLHGALCPHCGSGLLHTADYPRRPRGVPAGAREAMSRRFSFCCSACRQRVTPSSARFLGRRLYAGALVVAVSVLLRGGAREAGLARSERPCARTLRRWRCWWQEVFSATAFWRGARGRFATPVPNHCLPHQLLECFVGELASRMRYTLRFLRPITTTSCARLAMDVQRR